MHTKRGAGLIVMGVGGGAWYPSAQAALADKMNTRISYLIPMIGYVVMLAYAMYILSPPLVIILNSDISLAAEWSSLKHGTADLGFETLMNLQ